ncbi:MAG TPA: methyltransferase domain-containing protein [Burkholderiales bacterium]|nr:methyltransferase domain-containing protein [Burkholderiales bacterium]
MERPKRAYWEDRSSGPPAQTYPAPLAPCAADVLTLEARVEAHARGLGRRPLRALLLGVTRPLAEMRMPAGASLLAVDWSRAMIARWWAERPRAGLRAAVLADWRELPFGTACLDLALGDGCYAALGSFEECADVNAELRRVLRPGGQFVQRCFVRPDAPEPLDALFGDLGAGRIRVFEVFCWRLAMALHDDSRRGVKLHDVWRVWNARAQDPAALLARLGWNARALGMIERWRGVELRMPFPTLAELRALAAPWFELEACSFAGYEMGDRCAYLALRARP